MNPQNRADQAFESWLVDGPTRMPEHLVDSIVTQLEQTHQRKHLWLPGREQMNRMMVAVGGVAADSTACRRGPVFRRAAAVALGTRPTPSPTPLPTSRRMSPRAGISPTVSVPLHVHGQRRGLEHQLNPGNIIVDEGQTTAEQTLPTMWLGWSADATQMVWGTACAWTGTSFTPGPSVDDLSSAIAGLTDSRRRSRRPRQSAAIRVRS